jgi:hypothetical protein
MKKRPRFVFNDGTAADITLTYAQRPWRPGSRGVGGSDVSAAGVPEAFEVRRDERLKLRLRFTEAEWTNVRRMIVHGQNAGTITFYPDADLGTNHTVYLDEPKMGEEIDPQPTDTHGIYEIAITIRRTTEVAFTDQYFD